MGLLDLYRQYKRPKARKQLEEHTVGTRYRRYRYLAPIKVHTICLECHAPCCKLAFIHTAITMAEALSVYRSKKTRPWVLNIHYPEKALWHRSLRRRGDIRPRFLRVGSIRMRSGGPDYGKVEVYLAKKPDGSCIHFCGDHCSIYARRPHACKAWFCGRGTDDETVWRQLCDEERDLWTPKQQFSELKLEMPDDEGPALRCDLPKRKALSQCD